MVSRKIERIVLDNGLVLLLEKRKSKKAVMQIGIKVGSINEDQKLNGGSHFNEHMLFKSNSHRTAEQIIMDMESVGTNVNAFTSEAYTATDTKSMPEDIERIVEIFFEAYKNHNYNEEEFEKERKVILTEIKMYDEDPTMYCLTRMFMSELFNGHPLGKPIAGPADAMASVTKKELEDFKKAYYAPNNTAIVVVGNFDSLSIEKKVRATFGSLEPKATSAVDLKTSLAHKQETKFEAKGSIKQVYLALGYRTEGCESADVHKIMMLKGILSSGMASRMFQELREKRGIGYSVGVFGQTFPKIGYICAYIAGFEEGRYEEAVNIIVNQFNDLKKNLVTKEEFERTKKMLLSSFYDSLESIDKRADSILRTEFFSLPYDFRKLDKLIKNSKREGILEMARKYLTDGYVLTALVPEGFNKLLKA